ncbi:NHL repeat-containing protein [Halothiobacillus diazotrophicus]|uniref:NHL repeat-containing protein n=1 Tax=Halothiobacillus diazotrophicus TaxID=1860122 RepID=UPI0009EF465A|nr:NHL repeat-containing protein [Halothiobacillus diazotrophicus]
MQSLKTLTLSASLAALSLGLAGCPDTTTVYTISGSVTGLDSAASVTLLNNGKDSLTVTRNGNFVFPAALVDGATYSVTVGTQPIGETCTVRNGSGVLVAGNVTNVSVTCGTPLVSTLAGSTTPGAANGLGAAASFYYPTGVAVDTNGNLYVADTNNFEIRKITAAGLVTTLAGTTTQGSADGIGAAAGFSYPTDVALSANGTTLYVADSYNNEIRTIDLATGMVNTFAGSTTPGFKDGVGTAAGFHYPKGVKLDTAGNLYIADFNNNAIRKITPGGVVTTLAGSGAAGATDGTGTAATFNHPKGIAVDAQGNVYVGDVDNNEIRKVTPAGVVTTLAGSTTPGAADGIGSAASFKAPKGVALNADETALYVADGNNEIRRIDLATRMVTTVAGSTTPGTTNGPAASASFNNPVGIALDATGNIYVGDTDNHQYRKITP